MVGRSCRDWFMNGTSENDPKWWALWSTDLYSNFYVVETGLTFAEALAVRDESYGGRGIATPDRYVTHRMNVLVAAEAAKREFDSLTSQFEEGLTLGRMMVGIGTPAYWNFTKDCEQWAASGKIPGKLSCSIDAVDGTVWSDEKQEKFLLEQQPDG